MKNLKIFDSFLLGLILMLGSNAWTQVTTYDFTGDVQTYTVPPGVTNIQIEAYGAEGGTGTYGGFTPIPGLGGYSIGELSVVPGEILEVYVGGQGTSDGPGGYNGGGQSATNYGAAGGGASDVRKTPYGLDDRAIVGGGGGGAAFGSSPSNGGDGGGLNGVDGQDMDEFFGGGGGTQVSGGAAGCCYGSAEGGFYGLGGGPGDYHNAGGGGGWYGGGSGAGQAGAGGGSSYIDGLTDAETTSGVREGNGQVIISVLCIALSLEPVDTDICEGESFILDASSETGGIVMWDGGVVNGEEFYPGGVGSYTYTATSTSGTDCNYVVEITVHGLPTIIANAYPETVCYGQELTLYGSGGAFYEWGPGDIDNGEPFIADEIGTFTYSVEGEDWYGCFNSDEITVTVVESPEIAITASDDNICLGESLTLTASGALTYEWDGDVENGISFIPEESGTFTYNVDGFVDGDGCFGEASIEISVNESPTIESYIMLGEEIGDDGSINITVTGGTPAYDFDWDNDGVGEFGDPEDLIGIPGGIYIVVIKDANDCEDTETITVDTQLGLIGENTIELTIYPNPSSDMFTIDVAGVFNYTISNLNGEVLINGQGNTIETVDLTRFASGVYFVEVQSLGKSQTIKLIKK